MGRDTDTLKRSLAIVVVIVVVGSILAGGIGSSSLAGQETTTRFGTTTSATTGTTGFATTGTTGFTTADGREQTQTALIRLAHMAPNASPVDVRVEGQLLYRSVSYGNVTSYLRIPSGQNRIVVTPANDSDTRLYEATVQVAPDGRYTLAATRNRTGLNVRVFRDRIPRPRTGRAAIRVINLAQNASPARVVANETGRTLVRNVRVGMATEYVTVPSRFYSLNLVSANDPDRVLTSFGVSLERGTAYTVFVVGSVGGNATAGGQFDVFVNVDAVRSGLRGTVTGGFGTTTPGFGTTTPAFGTTTTDRFGTTTTFRTTTTTFGTATPQTTYRAANTTTTPGTTTTVN